MGPLLLAAFTFSLNCAAPVYSLDEKQLIPANIIKVEKKTFINELSPKASAVNDNLFRTVFVSSLSPTVNLKDVSWLTSEFADRYDPQVQFKVRRSDNRGMEATIQLTIPL